jgi:hypothetical protein
MIDGYIHSMIKYDPIDTLIYDNFLFSIIYIN